MKTFLGKPQWYVPFNDGCCLFHNGVKVTTVCNISCERLELAL